MANSVSGAGAGSVCHIASSAASLVCWDSVTVYPDSSPSTITDAAEASPNAAAMRNERLANSMFRPFSRYQDEMASTNTEPVTYPALTVCTNFAWAVGLNTTDQKSANSIRIVSWLKVAPTGSCIQPLAIRIQSAERLLPMASIIVTIRCAGFDSRSQPKKNRPTNVDSRKNAISPSTASGTPKMSPT